MRVYACLYGTCDSTQTRVDPPGINASSGSDGGGGSPAQMVAAAGPAQTVAAAGPAQMVAAAAATHTLGPVQMVAAAARAHQRATSDRPCSAGSTSGAGPKSRHSST
jgi:hypothetical protein